MEVSLFARPYLAPDGDIGAYLEIAKLADEAALYAICFGEHIVMAENTARYPYGPWIHPLEADWFDPLTTLAGVATVTRQIRLSTGVLLVPLRTGVELAKTIATLDVLSGGRTELGVGIGWQSEEYTVLGLAWEDRYGRFDAAIEACRAAWGSQPFTIETNGVVHDNLRAYPLPIQERIPLLYGVKATPKNARRIARLGDGWTPVGLGMDDLRAGIELIRAEFAAAGRDPETAIFRVGLPPVVDEQGGVRVAAMFEAAESLAELGATQLAFGFNKRLDSLDEAADIIGQVAEHARAVKDL